MLSTISLPFGGLLFTVILLIVYRHKTKVAKHKNNYFLALLYLVIGVLTTEIGTYFAMMNIKIYPVINEIVCRVHSIFVLGFIITLGSYISSFINSNSKKDYFKNRNNILVLIFIASVIISLFLPFKYVIKGDSAYMTGIGLGFLYAIGLIIVIISSILVLVNQKDILISKTFPIIVTIVETAITVPLSLKFPTAFIITTSFVFKTYLIYFTLENPDLYLISELSKTKKKADDSNRAKSDFISNMSTEIRTPMNAILNFSESLLNTDTFNKEEALKDIEHIYAAGGNLLEIINNILDISKIESGEDIVNNTEYNLSSVILELHSLIDSRLSGTKVRFVTNIDETLPTRIYGDKTKVFQILLNVLSNAVKYTEVGRIELKIKGEVIKDEVLLHIRVSDTGIGIKENDYNKLFERLGALELAADKQTDSRGLGLIITKKLVALLGGKLWFESRYGAGTDFYIDISQKIVDKTYIGDIFKSESQNQNHTKTFDCSGKKALLVDDNELNLKVAKKLLSPYNFEITTLNSGKDCVDLIKSGEVYDIIFLDHMMPGMDGIEVLHIIKSLKTYDIPPVIALTANAITGMKEMYLKEGFDEYLSKPININELNKILEKYFKK